MKARLITRCGCERIIAISAPPPPVIWLPLRPPKFNEGNVRPWMSDDAASRYDPSHANFQRRIFKVSLESLDLYQRHPDAEMIWYDEQTDYDPPGYDPGKRTYKPKTEEGK